MSNATVASKHYVTYYSPGTFFSESNTKPIGSWDLKEAVTLAEDIMQRHGAKPYGFRFSTQLEAGEIEDGRGGFLKVEPKTIETSGLYMLGGVLETIDEVYARNKENESIIRSNMRYNDSFIVCVNNNSYKSMIPFNEDCAIVDVQGNIVESGSDPKWKDYRREAAKKYRNWQS